jgi:RNA polymerase sigma factor (sigma-70 family)
MVAIVVTPPSQDDQVLWAAAVAGDADAFGLLFDRYADVVYRYALARLRNIDLAEEVVATVFSEAWRQRARIELRHGSLRPWLLGVARNQANRTWAQQAREQRRDRLAEAGVVADHAGAVAGRIDAQSELATVLDALAALPDAPRETLILHVWGELSHDEVATELGISVGTVKSRLSRARSRLAATLRPHREVGSDEGRAAPGSAAELPREVGA